MEINAPLRKEKLLECGQGSAHGELFPEGGKLSGDIILLSQEREPGQRLLPGKNEETGLRLRALDLRPCAGRSVEKVGERKRDSEPVRVLRENKRSGSVREHEIPHAYPPVHGDAGNEPVPEVRGLNGLVRLCDLNQCQGSVERVESQRRDLRGEVFRTLDQGLFRRPGRFRLAPRARGEENEHCDEDNHVHSVSPLPPTEGGDSPGFNVLKPFHATPIRLRCQATSRFSSFRRGDPSAYRERPRGERNSSSFV